MPPNAPRTLLEYVAFCVPLETNFLVEEKIDFSEPKILTDASKNVFICMWILTVSYRVARSVYLLIK